jgi:hypothetical protein
LSKEVLEAELNCAHCHEETLHELVYAGRLLVSTTCSVCNSRVEHESNDLWDNYLKDLPHRIATKPYRLWKRFWRTPKTLVWTLPKATFGKPFKMLREYRNLKKQK